MNLLPIEILTKIAQHLQFSDRKCFSLVNLKFYHSVHFKELWQNIIFVIGQSILSEIKYDFLVILTHIKFFSVTIKPDELCQILNHTPNLLHLDLMICPNLFQEKKKLYSCFKENISIEVRRILNNLRSLGLSGNKTTITDEGFNCIIENCCTLHSLDLAELEIENLIKPWNWSDDETSKHCISNHNLTFANIISQIVPIASCMKQINLCSTGVGFEDLLALSTIPNLKLTKLVLDNCKNVDTEVVDIILNFQNSSLENISLLNNGLNNMNLMDRCIIQLKNLREIRMKINGVIRLVPPRFSHHSSLINYLYLSNCAIDDRLVENLNKMKLIRNLNLIGCNFSAVGNSCLDTHRLFELNLELSYGFNFESEFIHSVFYNLSSNLKSLRLDSVRLTDAVFDLIYNVEDKLPKCLDRLQTLSVVGCNKLTGVAVANALQGLSFIKVLRIQGVKQIGNAFFQSIYHISRSIEEINLSGSDLSDDILIGFLKNASRLRRLRMDGCCNLSKHLVVMLPIICPYLQDLSMRNCDAIEYPITLNYYDSLFLYQCYSKNDRVHNANENVL